jgi:hypothetical protein
VSGAVTGSSVVGGATVYCVAPSGTLYAFDAATGRVRAALAIGGTPQWVSLALSGWSIFMGTWSVITVAGIR